MESKKSQMIKRVQALEELLKMKMSLSTDITIKNSRYLKVRLNLHFHAVDEIPIVLLELNESALAFITREQFEKALLLL